MARSSRGTPLYGGIMFLTICSIWLVLMLSNRSVVVSLFFLGSQPFALPVGFWLFGAFVVGNGISLGILSFLQFAIVRLAQDEQRSGFSGEGIPLREGFQKNASSKNSAQEPEWEEDEFDWEESPVDQKSAQTTSQTTSGTSQTPDSNPRSANRSTSFPEVGEQGAKPSDPAGQNETSPRGGQERPSYSPTDRSATGRPQESVNRPQSPKRKSPDGLFQKVVDVNYRIINPGSTPSPQPQPRQKERDQGWDDSANLDDW